MTSGTLEYWRRHLADLPALRLPTDRPATGGRGPAERSPFRLPADVVRKLSTVASSGDAPVFAALLAGCQVLLARYSGQRDVALGTLAPAGVVIVRQAVARGTSFADLVAGTAGVLREAATHAGVAFDRIAREVPAAAEAARVLVVPRATAGLPAADLLVEFTTADDGSVRGAVTADSARYDPDTVRRLARHLGVLLTAAAADPDRTVGDLPLLDPAERHTLLTRWGVNRVDRPADRCVHDLFAQRAGERPDAVAVVDSTGTTTYAELDAHAGRLTALLLSHGVRPGGIVAVCLPRGAELVAALLAVLRTGCAYLPLDPGYPADRLAFMLDDAEAALCLTRRPLADRLPPVRLVCLDDPPTPAQSFAPPAVPTSPRDPAYVIYTSGSTGRPKGTVVEHRSITRLVCDADYVELSTDDVVAQAADATFDAATYEIWAPLVAGARIVVIDKDTLLDPIALITTLTRHGTTTLFLTTAVFNQVVGVDPGAFRGLRHVLFGGEAVNSARVAQVLAAQPPRRLLHVYGPTETTTFATWHLVGHADEHTAVPIGRPIANTTCYVLDERREPVPIGIVGELYIGGPGVARGYLKRPDLTAERFLADPFAGEPDGRMYRTGDLVRWLAGGTLEYVGRVDHQVKIRGFRIEPGEIELVLQQHPDVTTSVVVPQDCGEHKRLVAYVHAAGGRRLATAELRDFVAERLPAFMVPAVFVSLATVPLTASGKIDRRALPEPAVEVDTDADAAPRTDAERLLAAIWSEVLGVARVGITDNFYELGGDSVLGIKVVARARKAGLSIATREVFRRQTIAELATVAVASDPQP